MKRRVTKKRTFFLIVAITFITIYVVSGCQSQSPTTYHIGLVKKVGMEPLYLAQEKEFFKSEGIKVDLIELQKSALDQDELKKEIIDQLNRGTIGAFVAPLKSIISADSFPPIKIVIGIDEPTTDNGIITGDYLAFNQKVLTQSPENVQKIVNAVSQAIAYRQQNTEETNKIMAPIFQLDTAQYAEQLKGVRFIDLNGNREYFGTKEKPGPIFQVAKQASVNPESIISTEFVKASNTFVGESIKKILEAINTSIVSGIAAITVYIITSFFDYTQGWFGQVFARFWKTNKIKFMDAEVTLYTKDKFIEEEGKLNLESQVLVHALDPLESTELTVARRIYLNVNKEIFYDYIFPFGELTELEKVTDSRDVEMHLGKMVRVVRNMLIAYLIFDSKFYEDKNKIEILQWYKDHSKDNFFCNSFFNNFTKKSSEVTKDNLLDLIDKKNDQEIKRFLDHSSLRTRDYLNREKDIWNQIKHYITIHIIPSKLYETICIYKIQEDVAKINCFVRLNPNAFLKMLPEEASRKLKSYETYRKRHSEKNIFEIHTDKENDGKFSTAIETILKDQWKELMPTYMKDYIDDHNFCLYKIHPKSIKENLLEFWNKFHTS